ncbi:MAG: ThuA domain-containing protein [Candidatus Poribacteria bacterium]|nr:ThuA domain-containing protein [Candidatus Poribacteria bacterium]
MTNSPQPMNKIKTAVITGQHAFDVPGFHALFRSIPDIDFYLQDLENFAADAGKVRNQYDALVFYNFHQETPGAHGGRIRQALEQLGETQQGILVLHHAILAFPQWSLWSDICGIGDRRFGYDPGQTVHTEIVNASHPITQGLTAWEMVDETYTMENAGEGSEILLTTEDPKSMQTLAWTRQYKNARVFCYQSGHDNRVFSDSQFRAVISRGIQWLAGRI